MLPALTLATVAFILSFIGTRVLLGVLRRRAILDRPNDRSSHTVPTPLGGGLAVVAATALAWTGWIVAADRDPWIWTPPLLAGIALSILSFADDIRSLPASVRLAGQALAVAAGLWVLDGNGAFPHFLPPALDLAATALAWLWFVNLYNFMDGIDGIVASGTVALGIGAAALAMVALAPAEISAPGLILAGAAGGFLVWNWHPARVFLGDAGSVPLGYLVGFLLIAIAGADRGNGQTLVAALVLPMVFTLDTTATLLRRLARGRRPTEGHREHAYQRAVQAGWSHSRVCLFVTVVNLALIAIAALLSGIQPWLALTTGLALTALALRVLSRQTP